MRSLLKHIFLLLLIGSIAACSRKKNTFLNRNWHAITAEYNTLYNGYRALELGKEELNQTYQDSYWQILPVEPMHIREEVAVPGSEGNPNFAVAEEKAVKAIQRHSMLIEGREKNPQIDEAYLLLGKARYYNQRFIPALEAFNYILHKYPLGNSINEAKIWREKTNIRLEFDELAIKNLKEILEGENLDSANRSNALAALAQAYLNISSPDSAVQAIQRAARLTDDNREKGRYWFITGQLYDLLGENDSAHYAYEEVIDLKRKTPREYLVHAQIAQIPKDELQGEDRIYVLEYLTDLAENRENRPFLAQIYFELAEFHHAMDSVDLAIDYYNQSLQSPSSDVYLQSLDYERLGNIHFDAANYEIAGAYYDSTLQKLGQNTREYRFIEKKRDHLNDVIYYENRARSLDSILTIAALPEEEQRDFYTKYTTELKETAVSETGGEPTEENVAANYFEKKRTGMPTMPTPGSNFYFYNPTTVAYGKQEFDRIWGDRSLADNWRTGETVGFGVAEVSGQEVSVAEDDPKYDPETYLARLPKDQKTIDSLASELNFANYQLGLIYREKFDENQLAAEKLEKVLASQPEERLLLPSMYNLYKIYQDLGLMAKATAVKTDILFQFPDSRYAAILENPERLEQDGNNPSALYAELFEMYERQEYKEMIDRSEGLIRQFTGDEIVPKIELLKAMAEGRLKGLDAYTESLNFVALNYPQTPEGKKAQELLDNAVPNLPSKEFTSDSLVSSFKLVFPFAHTKTGEIAAYQQKIEKALADLDYEQVTVSVDVYDTTKTLVVVHNFSSASRAMGFGELLNMNKEYDIQKNSYYISTPNYRTVQIHKNLEEYINQY